MQEGQSHGQSPNQLLDCIIELLQAPDWFPMAQSLGTQYSLYAQVFDTGFDTLLASMSALLVFFGLPAMDMILGIDSRTPAQVSLPLPADVPLHTYE